MKTLGEIEKEQPVAIKLKQNGNEGEIETVKAIAARFYQPLVLDINANWDLATAEQNLAELRPLASRILWIEQPLPPDQMQKLPGPFRFYADEAVAEDRVGDFYDGVVLKPAIYGIKKNTRACRTI